MEYSNQTLKPEPPKAPRRQLNSAPVGEGDLDTLPAPQRPTTSDRSTLAAAEASIVAKVNPRHALALLLKESAEYSAQWANKTGQATSSRRSQPLGAVINGKSAAADHHAASPDSTTDPLHPSPPSTASSPVIPAIPMGSGNSARVTSTLLRQLKTITTTEKLCDYETELRTLINGNQTRQWSHIYHSKLVLVCHYEERHQMDLEHQMGAKRIADEERAVRLYGSALPTSTSSKQQSKEIGALVVLDSIPAQRLICEEINGRVDIQLQCLTLPAIAEAYAKLISLQLLESLNRELVWLKRFEQLERHEIETRMKALLFGAEQLETDHNRAKAWLMATKQTDEFKGSERRLLESQELETRLAIEEKERKFFGVYVAEAYQQRRWVLSTDVPTWETTKRARLELDEEQQFGIFMSNHRKGVRTAYFAAQQNAFISREDTMRHHLRNDEASRIQHILTWADRRWYELYQMRLLADEANAPLRFLEHDEVCKRRDIEQAFRNQIEELEMVEFDRRRDVRYLDQQRQSCFEEYVDGRLILQHLEQQQWQAIAKEIHLDKLYVRSLDLRRDIIINESYERAMMQNTTDESAQGLKSYLVLLNVQAEEETERLKILNQGLSKLALLVAKAADAPVVVLSHLSQVEGNQRDSIRTEEESQFYMFLAHVKSIVDGGAFNLELKLLRQAESTARHCVLVAEAQYRLEEIEFNELFEDESSRRITRRNQELSVRAIECQELIREIERVNRKLRLMPMWQEEIYALAKEELVCRIEEIKRKESIIAHEEQERKYLRILFNRVNPLFKYESLLWATEEAECDHRMAIESQGELAAAAILRMVVQDLFPWTLGSLYYLKQLLGTRPVTYVTIRSVADEVMLNNASASAAKGRAMAEAYNKQSITGEGFGPSPRKPICITWGAFMLDQLLVENQREADYRSRLMEEEALAYRSISLLRHEDLQRTALYELQAELWSLSMAACRRVMYRDQNRELEVYAGVFQHAEDEIRTSLWIQERQDMLRYLSSRNEEEQAIADRRQEELRMRILVWQGPLLNEMYEERRAIAQNEFDSIQEIVGDFRRTLVNLYYESEERRQLAVTPSTTPYLQESDVATLLPTREYYGVSTSPKISDKYQLKYSTLRAERHGAALETSAQLIGDDLALRDIIETAENEEFSQIYSMCYLNMPWHSHRDVEKAHLARVKMELLLMVARATEREVVAGQFVRGEPSSPTSNIKRFTAQTVSERKETSPAARPANPPPQSTLQQIVPDTHRFLIRDLFKERDEVSSDETKAFNEIQKLFLRAKDTLQREAEESAALVTSTAASMYLRCGSIVSDNLTLQAIAKACEIIATVEKRMDSPSKSPDGGMENSLGDSESDDEDLQIEFALRVRVASDRSVAPLPPPTLMYLAADSSQGLDSKNEIILIPEYISNISTVIAAQPSPDSPRMRCLTDSTALVALYERHLKSMRGEDDGFLDVCWVAPVYGTGSQQQVCLQVDTSLVAVIRTATQGIQSIIDVMSGELSVNVLTDLLKGSNSEANTVPDKSLVTLRSLSIPMQVHGSILDVLKANTIDGDISNMKATLHLMADAFLRNEEDLHALAAKSVDAYKILQEANMEAVHTIIDAISKAGLAEAEAIQAEQQQRRAVSFSALNQSQQQTQIIDEEERAVASTQSPIVCQLGGAHVDHFNELDHSAFDELFIRIHPAAAKDRDENTSANATTTIPLAKIEGNRWVISQSDEATSWNYTLPAIPKGTEAPSSLESTIVVELVAAKTFKYLTELQQHSEYEYLALLTSTSGNQGAGTNSSNGIYKELVIGVAEVVLGDWATAALSTTSGFVDIPLWSEVTNQKAGSVQLVFSPATENEL